MLGGAPQRVHQRRRCLRASDPDGPRATLAAGTLVPYPESFFFSKSLTSAGLALPWVARMTWPTKKP